jgi:hypothetical protein
MGSMAVGGVTGGALGYGVGEFVGGVIEGYSTAGQVQEGMQLFRVFGGEARGLGQYYTTVNPSSVPNYRSAAGLYPGNSGGFLLEGTLNNTNGVVFGAAKAGPRGVGGGLPEVFVPNAASQITVRGVWGVNPPF